MIGLVRRMCVGIIVSAVASSATAQTAFYLASALDLIGPLGSSIRTEMLDPDRNGASAYRVLYRSIGLHDEPIAVSGTIIVPHGPAPTAGHPIVAWAHPTSGIIPPCAPSLGLFRFQQIQGLRSMVARSYIVTATDYPGLGTAGPHPYIVDISEGRAFLNSVCAAATLVGGGHHDVALWGHSQGGQAVLYAGLPAPFYAPEMHLSGIAAAAPAT